MQISASLVPLPTYGTACRCTCRFSCRGDSSQQLNGLCFLLPLHAVSVSQPTLDLWPSWYVFGPWSCRQSRSSRYYFYFQDNTGATISAGSGESAVETAVASTAISSATASASANVSSPSQTADITSTAASAQETSENGNSGAAGGGGNIQTFTGALGGIPAPAVTPGGRGFNVADNDSFLTANAALGRSCDVQHNKVGRRVCSAVRTPSCRVN